MYDTCVNTNFIEFYFTLLKYKYIECRNDEITSVEKITITMTKQWRNDANDDADD